MTAAIDRQSRRLALAALVIGPALLIAGTAIGYNPGVIFMLPMGTAWVQGAIALPLVVLGPAVLSLAWSYGGAVRAARVVAAAISVLFVVVIAGYVAMTATQIGCQPVTNPIQTLPQGVAWGAIAAAGFWGAVRSGAVFAQRGRLNQAVLAAAGVALLGYVIDAVAFLVLFPPLSCPAPSALS